MRKSIEQREREAIKLRKVFFPHECDICHAMISREKMWNVLVESVVVNEINNLFFCQDCIHSSDEVLELPEVFDRIVEFKHGNYHVIGKHSRMFQ